MTINTNMTMPPQRPSNMAEWLALITSAITELRGEAWHLDDSFTVKDILTSINNDKNLYTTLMTIINTKLKATDYNAADVLAKLKTVDGNGSGLDADVVKGYVPVNKAGDAMTGFLTLHADPANPSHAVTKHYVDELIQGFSIKESVRALADTNVALTGLQTIDDVALQAGDRVLLTNQATRATNGIYVVAAAAWTRATDADNPENFSNGAATFVTEGTKYGDSGWILTTDTVPVVIGTTALEFNKFSGAGQIIPVDGLYKTGNQMGLTDTGVTPGEYTKITVDIKGRVTIGKTLIPADIPNLDWVKITSGKPTTLGGYGITDGVNISDVVTTATANKILKLDTNKKLPASITGDADGNAGSATKLQTSRTIATSGAATGSVSFDGTGNVTIPLTLKDSGVVAGTYTKITVDAKGSVTVGATLIPADIPNLDWTKITSGKPTTLSGYGITDGVNVSEVVTTATANKILKLDGNGKLPTSITGDAITLDGLNSTQFVRSDVANTVNTDLTIAQDKKINLGTSGNIVAHSNGEIDMSSGGVMKISSDIDHSNPSEYTSILSGNNELRVTSSGTGTGSTNLTYNGSTVWTSGNDGSGSSSDADLVDGKHFTDIQTDTASQITALKNATGLGTFGKDISGTDLNNLKGTTGFYKGTTLTNAPNSDTWWNVTCVAYDGGYSSQLAQSSDHNTLFTRIFAGGTWVPWREIAGIDSNVASATKLHTARTINLTGEATGSVSFDGTGNVNISTSLTATAVRDKLKTVDGSGSGVDADLLDGLDSSQFLRSDVVTGVAQYSDASNPTLWVGDAQYGLNVGNGRLYLTNTSGNAGNGANVFLSNGVGWTRRVANQDDIDTLTSAKLNLSGGTMTGLLKLSGDPTDPLHATTKQYVDGLVQGIKSRTAALVSTTANITLSGLQTIDGITVVAGDRVLVKDQTDGKQNGVYIANASAWSRADEYNENDEFDGAIFVFVEKGTANADTGWVLQNDDDVVIGTSVLTFVQFSRAGVTEGDNTTIVRSGNIISQKSGIVTAGTYTKLTVDTYGRVNSGSALSPSDIPNLDWGKLTSGKPTTLGGYGITDAAPASHQDVMATYDTLGHVRVGDGLSSNDGGWIWVSTGEGLTLSGTSPNMQVAHADTSTQGSITNSANTVIQSVALDGFGHVTALTSKTMTSADVDALSNDDVVTTATANKVLRLNSSSKLPASITGNADGNASTATKLQTARTISLTGEATGSVSFDGTGNVNLAAYLTASSVRDKLITVDGSGSGIDADLLDGLDSSQFYQKFSTQVIGTSDWNTYISAGAYIVNAGPTMTGNGAPPNAYGWGILKVDKGYGDSDNRTAQTFLPHTSDPNIYTRVYNSGDWTAWRIIPSTGFGQTVWTSNNDGSGSGLDADLLDGLESSQFLRRDRWDHINGNLQVGASTDPNVTLAIGDNDTGLNWVDDGHYRIIANNQNIADIYQDHADFLKPLQQNGVQVATVNDNNAKVSKSGDTMTGNLNFSNDDQGLFMFDGTGFYKKLGTGAVIKSRGASVQVEDASNSNIYKIWHSGNQGAGSGMDADLLDGIQANQFLRADTVNNGNQIRISGSTYTDPAAGIGSSLKVSGGVATDTLNIGPNVALMYNSTENSLDIVFA